MGFDICRGNIAWSLFEQNNGLLKPRSGQMSSPQNGTHIYYQQMRSRAINQGQNSQDGIFIWLSRANPEDVGKLDPVL